MFAPRERASSLRTARRSRPRPSTIGYHIPAGDLASSEYTDSTARAVATFMDRYFSGVRVRPDAAYSWNVDFDTAQMIKRVLRAVTP